MKKMKKSPYPMTIQECLEYDCQQEKLLKHVEHIHARRRK
jgi:hypothetical protein